jgi:hypothetical protein
MSRLQTAWRTAAKDLRLETVVPFTLKTETFSITAEILLKHFGAENGMLIVSDYKIIEPHHDKIIQLGYGYATLTEPDQDWPFTAEEKEAFIEMLSDWGWFGPGEAPAWLLPDPEESTED